MTAMDYEPVPLEGYPAVDDETLLARAEAAQAALATRRTVRDFSDRPVPRAVIEACLRAAGSAPSGANHQPWHFACVSDPALKRQIREAAEAEERSFYEGRGGARWLKDLEKLGTDASKPFLETAPWLIAIFAQPQSPDEAGDPRKNYYVKESVGLATGFLLQTLHSAGLATLTHTPNPMKFLNAVLGRPASERPFVLLVVGHPAEEATVPRYALHKKPLEAIASFFS
jgi:nitroreductase